MRISAKCFVENTYDDSLARRQLLDSPVSKPGGRETKTVPECTTFEVAFNKK
jgi:hypothetical protein